MSNQTGPVKNLFIAAFVATLLFTVLNSSFINAGLFTFHSNGPIAFSGLPVMAIAAIFVFVLAGLGLYIFLNRRFPDNLLDSVSLMISNLLLGVFVAIGYFGYTKVYTITIFALLFFLLIYVEYRNTARFMYRFYRTFAILLIPVWLISYFLIDGGILSFNPEKRLDFELGIVPLENYAYAMALFLVSVFMFEKLNRRKQVS